MLIRATCAYRSVSSIKVLDPNYKLAYVEGRWDSEDVANGKASLEAEVSTFLDFSTASDLAFVLSLTNIIKHLCLLKNYLPCRRDHRRRCSMVIPGCARLLGHSKQLIIQLAIRVKSSLHISLRHLRTRLILSPGGG